MTSPASAMLRRAIPKKMNKTQIEIIQASNYHELQGRVNDFLKTLDAYVINIRYEMDAISDDFYAFIHYDPSMTLNRRENKKILSNKEIPEDFTTFTTTIGEENK